MQDLFRYELSSHPSSLFEASGFMRQAKKATLSDAIWTTVNGNEVPSIALKLSGEQKMVQHVIDGGRVTLTSIAVATLCNIPWNLFRVCGLCQKKLQYPNRRF